MLEILLGMDKTHLVALFSIIRSIVITVIIFFRRAARGAQASHGGGFPPVPHAGYGPGCFIDSGVLENLYLDTEVAFLSRADA